MFQSNIMNRTKTKIQLKKSHSYSVLINGWYNPVINLAEGQRIPPGGHEICGTVTDGYMLKLMSVNNCEGNCVRGWVAGVKGDQAQAGGDDCYMRWAGLGEHAQTQCRSLHNTLYKIKHHGLTIIHCSPLKNQTF